jgi:hypothetical protein
MNTRTRSQAKQEVTDYIDECKKEYNETYQYAFPPPLVLPIVPQYAVDIDFDEASLAWTANKKSIGNGSYKYMCAGVFKNGKKCNRMALNQIGCEYCKIHNHM